ncbi:MAG: fibronectin type III domain-containing protein [bacterium]|nr:fibronectin type III domain-containing protein [bacterium]
MNQNLLIGIVAAIIIVGGGGVWLFASGRLSPGTATTTLSTLNNAVTTPIDTTSFAVNPTASAPIVTTGTLVVASNSSAVMTGKVVPNGSQSTYWYEYGRTSSLGTRTLSQALGSGFVSISAPAFITGLSANTNYSYRLVAQNDFGTIQGVTLSFITNNNPPLIGSAPATRTDAATSILRTSATLSGHVTPNGSDTSYWFEYGFSSALGNMTTFYSAGAGTASVNESVTISNLLPATKYYFRMNAQNQFGTVSGALLSFTTSGPAAMSAPSADTAAATNLASTTATLHGNVNPNGASTSYWFEYDTDSSLGSLLGSTTHKVIVSVAANQTNVSNDLSGLEPNTNYWYRVVAMNSQGTTSGDIVKFKTK